MAKLHHKLLYLTRYLNRDLKLANSQEKDSRRAVDLATATVGTVLGDMQKAVQMRPVVASSEKTYQNHQHPYNLKVAILVSRHKVLDGDDYKKLDSVIGNLSNDQEAARKNLPLPRRHRFWEFLKRGVNR